MNIIFNKSDMIRALGVAQRTCCCYDVYGTGYTTAVTNKKAPNVCDCKYGVENEPRTGGESTGCPELRVLKLIAETLSDAEWSMLLERLDVRYFPDKP